MGKKKEYKWSSKCPDKTLPINLRIDWNQTIVTVLNRIHAENKKKLNVLIGIKVPVKFENIIKSLYYYDSDNNTIGNVYLVEFIDDDLDYMDIEGIKLKIENYE